MNDLLNATEQWTTFGYSNDLPLPRRIDTLHRTHLTLDINETEQFLGLYDGAGAPLSTTVWGYGNGANVTYPGPTIVAYEDNPIDIKWKNKLPTDGHLLPIDDSIHLVQPIRKTLDAGYTPTVTHLHGGHTEAASDGGPEQWFTQTKGPKGPAEVGPDFVSNTTHYDNDQDGATLWYHDHALGITRLNVYAGLAGFYLLEDENTLDLKTSENGADPVLPGGAYETEIVIQDRAFTTDGQLYYPAFADDKLPDGAGGSGSVSEEVGGDDFTEEGGTFPSALPEFFGDHIIVNGMAWPNLDVAQGDYKFRMLNGSDSRFYVLQLDNPDVAVTLTGTDTGLLENSITIMDGDGTQAQGEQLVLAPGDRVDLVFDFSGVPDTETVELINVGPAYEPFKGLNTDGSLAEAEAADSNEPVGHIMQFTVDAGLGALNATVNDDGPVSLHDSFVDWTVDVVSNKVDSDNVDSDNVGGDNLGDNIADIAVNVRRLGLFEGADEFGRVNPLLGTAEEGQIHTYDPNHNTGEIKDFGPLDWFADTTETPLLDTYEQWDVFNFTANSHPVHIHLTTFQVVGKYEIDFQDEDEDGVPDDTNGDGITYGVMGTDDFDDVDILVSATPEMLRPEDTGWQDTVEVAPGEMLSVVANFDRPGEYVWHCHILSHEDHEMMRPFEVVTDEADMWMPT